MRLPEVPGHFPGDPLIPGACLLLVVDDALRAEGLRLARVGRVRFLEPVRPGEEVEVELRREGSAVRFAVLGAGRARMRGVGEVVGVGGAG